MSDDTPLWALALNAFLGLALTAWMLLTMIPFLAGADPLLPGMEAAFIGAYAWAGWNARLIPRRDA